MLVEVGDITRFPDKNYFASWTGTAPIDASSGDKVRHRLSRGGNRQINRVLHIMATVQLRHPTTEGRAYYDRCKARGKTSNESMRLLKRRLSNLVYRTMLNDTSRQLGTGPGGHRGDDSDSSAASSQPHTSSSDKPRPGPARTDATSAQPGPPGRSSTRSRRTIDRRERQPPLTQRGAKVGHCRESTDGRR